MLLKRIPILSSWWQEAQPSFPALYAAGCGSVTQFWVRYSKQKSLNWVPGRPCLGTGAASVCLWLSALLLLPAWKPGALPTGEQPLGAFYMTRSPRMAEQHSKSSVGPWWLLSTADQQQNVHLGSSCDERKAMPSLVWDIINASSFLFRTAQSNI